MYTIATPVYFGHRPPRPWSADVMRYAHYSLLDDVPHIKPSMNGVAEHRMRSNRSFWRDERRFWDEVAWNIHAHPVIDWHSGDMYNLDTIMLSDWNIDMPVTMEEVMMFYYLVYFSQEKRIAFTVGELAYILSVDRQNYLSSLRDSGQTAQRIRHHEDDNTAYNRIELHWFGSVDLFPVMYEHIRMLSHNQLKRKRVWGKTTYEPDERYSSLFWTWAAMYPSYDIFLQLTQTQNMIRLGDVTQMYRERVVPSQQIPYDTLLRYWSRGCYDPAVIAAAAEANVEPDLAASIFG